MFGEYVSFQEGYLLLSSPCILFRSFGFNFKSVYKWGHPWKILLVCNKKTMCRKWWELVAMFVYIVYYKAILQGELAFFDHKVTENIQAFYFNWLANKLPWRYGDFYTTKKVDGATLLHWSMPVVTASIFTWCQLHSLLKGLFWKGIGNVWAMTIIKL